ncbi:uncharacterized protein LOC110719406 isoform X2 [Chenopodium quinoa]|uniref:uncharacterized protein LOC110719406 isoform X2 n=1 Tax=Chenopodium quinoa TaxID=63459 RepID=UPI000B7750D5|nr:uncharacterized protein LOC110719406 isoform X2 [Chenopodium quinoa]
MLSGDVVAFQAIEQKLRKNTTFFKLSPSNSLGSSSVLEWSLKTIETVEDASKKDLTKSTVARSEEIEYSDLNMNVELTPTKPYVSTSVNKEDNVTATYEDSTDSKIRDKGKDKISETTFCKFSLPSKGIVIADEGHRIADRNMKNKPLKHSTADTPATVNSPKVSPAEWTTLCRTRKSGDKLSPMTPVQNEDTKPNSVCEQSVVRKKLRLTTPQSVENEDHDSATKDPTNAVPDSDAKTSTPKNDHVTDL